MKKKLLCLLLFAPFLAFAQLPVEGFEGFWFAQTGTGTGGPVYWAIANVNGSNSWQQTPANIAYAGTYCAALYGQAAVGTDIPQDWLISPVITTTANPELRFFSRLGADGNQGGTYKIMYAYATNPQTSLAGYSVAAEFTELELNPVQTEWTEKTVTLPAIIPAGSQIYIAFVGQGDNADTWLIDNVKVGQQCLEPTNLTAVPTSDTSVTLGWTNPGGTSTFEIEVLPATGMPTGVANTPITSIPTVVSNLTPNTGYKFYVRSVCSDVAFSSWVGPFQFNTPGTNCSPVDMCNYTILASDAANDGWSGNSIWVMQNGIVVADLNLEGAGTTAELSVPLCHDAPFSLYWPEGGTNPQDVDIVLKNPFEQIIYSKPAGTGQPGTVLFEGTANCLTVDCFPPTNLTATVAPNNNVTFGINGTPNVIWEYYIVTAGSPAPIAQTAGVPATTNPALITNLLPNTNYVAYARIICDAENISPWEGPIAIATGTGNNLTGIIRMDANEDGVCNAVDYIVPAVEIVVTVNNGGPFSVYTNADGQYAIGNFADGVNTISLAPIAPAGFAPVTPVTAPIDFNEGLNGVSIDFCLEVTEPFADVQVTLLPITVAQPGFYGTYQLIVTNNGNIAATGTTATFTFNTTKAEIEYVGLPYTLNAGTISLDLGTIAPLSSQSVNIVLYYFEPPVNEAEDELEFVAEVSIAETDEVLDNNTVTLVQTVVNSYDPNDITVHEGATITEAQADDYLTYTIRFQNTGNFAATNVKITNALDELLDWNTFTPIASSHNYNVSRTQNLLEFTYNNIHLPDSTSNEAASHGFITYRVKPKSTYGLGDIVYSTADIYFDFNPAVITNTASTEVVATAGVKTPTLGNATLYPNPVKNMLTIKLRQGTVQNIMVLDVNGRQCLTAQNATTIDTQALKAGIYFVRITTDTGVEVKKIIKE
ncbi:T9SS-dependent choice-of-anchor J family protein [Flavobacterium subsaxonicum]|uniref:Fibronectin type-III domain-containing protein n=1 Tax=Flavobacterium subsaxonicum WB 4.1-42 = DSM 21790 TaxID=1121898 RepID=A0A0A2MJM1_9FLAO|nr:choice-of-anchor J domain-containing protein [Flavobacterium subsaxonicum]KGO91776.1 hypothetical protein Q766_16185 [Flavobacterium subsaxonicum WB 4.1-42 = DSM 21790]